MHIPDPPTPYERVSYVRSGRLLVYAAAVPSAVILLGGMALFSLLSAAFYWYLIYVGVISIYLGLSYFIGLAGKDFDLAGHEALREKFRTGSWRPTVDVLLPTCGEDLELLRNAYFAVASIRYPGLKVWVLDDGAREEVRKLAEEYGYNYVVRPDRGVLKKGGNLRHAFKITEGEVFLILDADFAPRSDILEDLLPYFMSPNTAIVQSTQFFSPQYAKTWTERGAVFIQELFYRLVQTSRDRWGAAICVGSCAIYRRKALEAHGGTYLIGYSEDVHTGWRAVDDGWDLKYLPLNLAQGVNADTANQFFTQQYRWSMGSLTLFFNPKFWTSRLTVMQKLSYLSGMLYYSATGLGVWLNPLPALMMIWVLPSQVHWYSVACAVPSLMYSTVVMSLWAQSPWGFYVMRARSLQAWAHMAALVDKLRGDLMPWVPTGVKGTSQRFRMWRDLSHFYLTVLFIGFMAGVAREIAATGRYEVLVPLSLFCFNTWLCWISFRD